MKHFDKNKYVDHSQALNTINNNCTLFDGILVSTGMDYIRKISGTLDNPELYKLRDSVSLRLQSIIYHYDLLASINISGREYFYNSVASPVYGDSVSLKQDFLFDSIIFNAMSFFDYLSCYMYFIVFGRKKGDWRSIVKQAQKNVNFKESGLAKTINSLHSELVNKLDQYRGELIHNVDDHLPNNQSYFFVKGTVVVTVFAPVRFREKFREEFKGYKNDQLDINSIALWLIDCITNGTIEILKEIKKFIESNRKVPKGKEIISFKKEEE
jgi:hypothetical protein